MNSRDAAEAHRKRVVDAAADLFEARTNLTIAIRTAPDESERTKQAVDLRGDGPAGEPVIVLEHTSVDSFVKQRVHSRWIVELLSPIERQLDGTLPGPGHYVLGVNPAESEGLKRSAGRVRENLVDWVRKTAPHLEVGSPAVAPRHCADHDVLQLGLNVTLCRWPHRDKRFFLYFNVPSDFEQKRRERLVQAFDDKCPKLAKAKAAAPGATSVLVLETCDVALGNAFEIAKVVREELSQRPDVPDSVYVIDTVGPGTERRGWSWLIAKEGAAWLPSIREPGPGRFPPSGRPPTDPKSPPLVSASPPKASTQPNGRVPARRTEVQSSPVGPEEAFWLRLWRWLQEKLGPKGFLLLGLLAALFGLWEKLDRPGLNKLKETGFALTHPIPHTKADHFGVAIALLQDDQKGDLGRNLGEALADLTSLEGLDLRLVPREIQLKGTDPRRSIEDGHELARRYLRESGADILIWGKVLEGGRLRLFWTTSELGLGRSRVYESYPSGELPVLFLPDLKAVLSTIILSRYAPMSNRGQALGSKLRPLIVSLDELLKHKPGFQVDTLITLKQVFANGLATLGDQSGDSRWLLQAVTVYEELQAVRPRERAPLDWATTQNNLGAVLETLGERESGTARLEEAAAAYRDAFKEFTRERAPLDWALVQSNVGNTLSTLGERESGTTHLEEAVTAHRDALKECTRGRAPLQWATTQTSLGVALVRLGERESGTARLEDAVTAHREALKELTRERVPLYWAAAQANLGNALQRLGERESGTAHLKEAVAAYRAALKEYTPERAPLDWVRTQNNLGGALRTLGERESSTARLEDAVTAHREALKELTREQAPSDWANTKNSLGTALATLGERESRTTHLEEAVAAYRDALKEYTRERAPLDWAMVQNNLGNTLRRLGDRASGTARLEEAVAAYREALKEYTRERLPLDWSMTQNNLGIALQRVGERESDTARVEEAVTAFREALKVRTRENLPPYWAMTQNNLGTALETLSEREPGTTRIEEAVTAYREALTVYGAKNAPRQHDMVQRNLERASRLLEKRLATR